jgi:LacI family transcriptional regulator
LKVTIKHIAELAGVSSAAVSKALNDHSDISDETKKRILEICKEVGYTPNEIARSLAKGRSNMMGLLIPDITSPIYSEIFKGLDLQAQEYGYSLFLCDTNRDIEAERKYVRILMEKRVNGIVIAPVSNCIDHITEVTRNNIPIVYIGGKVNDSMNNYITVDNFYGSKIAVDYLIRLGHKEIYMVCDRGNTKTMSDRIMGYRTVMTENNCIPVVYVDREGKKGRESGYAQAKNILSWGKLPSAIFTCNDMVAIGVMEALLEKGLKVPEDISLVGYDDIAFASLPTIKLTTVAQPKFEIGMRTINLLNKIMKNYTPDCKNREIVKPEFVIRRTCRRI